VCVRARERGDVEEEGGWTAVGDGGAGGATDAREDAVA